MSTTGGAGSVHGVPDRSAEMLDKLRPEHLSRFLHAAGLEFRTVDTDRVTARLEVGPDHHTPWGVVHGGAYTTAIESAASVGASLAVADQDMFAVGLNNNTDFLRASAGGVFDVVAEAIQQGRTQQLWLVTLTRPDGKAVARGQVRLQNVPPQPGRPRRVGMIIDPDDLDAAQTYKLLIGSVLPRPIAWVSTLSEDGIGNIAPISFFTVVGRKPPVLSVSLQPRSDGVTLKDTFVNIRDTGEFVVNVATLAQSDAVHRSAGEYPSDVDEFEVLGLGRAPSQTVAPPRIAESPISFECVVHRIFTMSEELQDHVVWGRVTRFHVRDDLYLERGRIDTGAVGAVGRLAAEYVAVDNVFTTPLPDEVLTALAGRRSRRLDDRGSDFSPLDTAAWSPSGSTTNEEPER